MYDGTYSLPAYFSFMPCKRGSLGKQMKMFRVLLNTVSNKSKGYRMHTCISVSNGCFIVGLTLFTTPELEMSGDVPVFQNVHFPQPKTVNSQKYPC